MTGWRGSRAGPDRLSGPIIIKPLSDLRLCDVGKGAE